MDEGKIRIVFVCVENAQRSQMAQGFAEAFGQGVLKVYSAGSRPFWCQKYLCQFTFFFRGNIPYVDLLFK
ncbi:MAG: hypothetical protein FJ110_13300 [Deltaproteobacteria bacterium]|nr:hypothetical protein [Deltaproteobacteria bacterium]